MVALVVSGSLIQAATHAQPSQPAGEPRTESRATATTAGEQPHAVNLEEEPAGNGPVTAGRMTEEAALGERLLGAERWREAAAVLDRVVDGDTGDDEGNRQIAQYRLAIALYRSHFYQASYRIFSEIADRPSHLRFDETLLWLAKLGARLPEPADVIERVGKYRSAQIERFDNPQQRGVFSQLSYLLGRYKHRNRAHDEAIRLFERVDRSSKHYVEAQFWSGLSSVQLRKAVPALRSFKRMEEALDEDPGIADAGRLRDLASLSIARIYYSAWVRLDKDGRSLTSPKLTTWVKYWDRVGAWSEYWLDAQFEKSWAYFWAGDYPRALGAIHTVQAPYFPDAFYPEAEVLKGIIAFSVCRYEDAITIIAKMQTKYYPIKRELEATLDRFKGEGSEPQLFTFLNDVRGGKADLSPTMRPVIEGALSDRQLLRNIEYVHDIDEERARFEQAPAAFRGSPIGGDIDEALVLARERAVRDAGALTRRRIRRRLEELRGNLRDMLKLHIDILNAQRDLLDEPIRNDQRLKREPVIYGVLEPDSKHVIWPFDGEYWRDELGSYRAVVVSKCAR
jgi:tetratricopeptide (TPR) repeat protein